MAEKDVQEPEEKEVDIEQELDADFEAFKESASKHDFSEEQKEETAEQEPVTEQTQDQNNGTENSQAPKIAIKNNAFDDFKLQMFLGIFFSLLDGLHLFIYNFISKHKLNREDLKLDETDQEALMPYFKTDKIMALINKLPNELIGVIHIEWLYNQKYKEAIEEKEEQAKLEADAKAEEEERAARAAARKKKKKKVSKP